MVIDDLIEIAEKERASRKKYTIRCCLAAGCMSSNSKGVKDALEKAVKDARLEDRVEVRGVGCMKLCCQGPLVQIDANAESAAPALPSATEGPHPPHNSHQDAASCVVVQAVGQGPSTKKSPRKTLPRLSPPLRARAPRPSSRPATPNILSLPSNFPLSSPTAASWIPNASSPISRLTATTRCMMSCGK